LAAKNGHLDVVQLLLEHGHPWNVVDNEYRTAGEYAQDAKHDDIYEMILSEGCRAELILSLLVRFSLPLPHRLLTGFRI
jgi:protein arginine N-methyltransferase 2